VIRIMINGVPTPSANAMISVLDHGFLYGDSVYEVVKTRGGRLFSVMPHLRRLRYSAEQVEIPIAEDDAFLIDELTRMVALVGTDEVYLRMVITRGVGEMGLNPDGCGTPTRIVYGKPFQPLPEKLYREGVTLVALAPERDQRGNVKSGANLSNLRASREAKRLGCHEALRSSEAGCVAECATSNIFWVKRGVLYTPAIGAGILKGVTRQLVLHVAHMLHIEAREGLFPLVDLLTAEEVFITSTTRDLLPVSRIGDTTFPMGETTRRLSKGFHEVGDLDIELY